MLPLRRIEGKYEVVRKLSEGGMGVLYLVRHRQLDELRVIKILRSTIDAEGDLRNRFVREARSAIQLRHPNIAQLYDFSVDEDGAAYMVLEYIDGVNLEDWCAPSHRLEVPMVVEIGRQALRALRFLHSKGYVHRDIAPDNLMLTRDAEGHLLVKLIDLGIVKVLRDETQKSIAGMYLGKPRYSSPEQLTGEELDGRSDLYSLGIALFELLTGRFPIPGKDFASLLSGHLYQPPLTFAEADPAGRVPEALRRLVVRAMHKDRNRRFEDADEMFRALDAAGVPAFADPDGSRLAAVLRKGDREEDATTRPYRGGTQGEIDRHFEEGRATPSPGTIEELAQRFVQPEETPARRPIVDQLASALERDDLPEASRLLAGATDEDLGLPEVRAAFAEIDRRMAEREAAGIGVRVAAPPRTGAAGASLDEPAQKALEGALTEADRLLRLGDTDAAVEHLEAVERRWPVWEMPPGLVVRYRALEEETRSLRIGARIFRAERALEEGALVQAEFELDEARRLDRSHPMVTSLAARLDAARAGTPEPAAPEPDLLLGSPSASFAAPTAPAARPAWLVPVLLTVGTVLVVLLASLLVL